ncbi:MAG: hypothetical protein WCX93_03495 [Burkholderiaceae bacterium]
MPDRRTVLFAGLAAFSASLPLRLLALPVFTLDAFVELSARLTGVPAAGLDLGAARVIYDAFQGRGLLPDLARLADETESGATGQQLGGELVAAWFSGLCETVNSPVVATYTSALLWGSAPFLHPSGVCGGITGYWGDPPTT